MGTQVERGERGLSWGDIIIPEEINIKKKPEKFSKTSDKGRKL